MAQLRTGDRVKLVRTRQSFEWNGEDTIGDTGVVIEICNGGFLPAVLVDLELSTDHYYPADAFELITDK